MSFTRTRLPGFWTFGSAVLPGEFEHIDDYAYAIDGKAGGTYAPTGLITIGGLGLTVSGPFIASDADTIDVNGALTINSGAQLNLDDNMVVGTGAIVGFTSGSFLTVQSGATVTFSAGSTVTFGGAITFGGSVTMNGALTCANTVALNGAATQTSSYTKSGTSAVTAERVEEVDPNLGAKTISTEADVWYVLSIVAGGTSTYTVKSSSPTPPTGAKIVLNAYNTGLTKSIEVQREDASLIATLETGDGGVTLVFWDGGWKLVGSWGQVTLSSVYS